MGGLKHQAANGKAPVAVWGFRLMRIAGWIMQKVTGCGDK